MKRELFQISLLVKDYDEAIKYYTEKLGFDLLEDIKMSPRKRWVRVAPSGSGCSLLLAKAATKEQRAAIGNQCGGRVFLFLHTDNIKRDHKQYSEAGVEFTEGLRKEVYGTVAVFKDLYGNKWDLIQTKK